MTPVEEFLSAKTIAVVGVSRNSRKFGSRVADDLRKKGFRVLPVNPSVAEIRGEKCYPSLKTLPEKADAAVFIVPPDQTLAALREAIEVGITRIWMQQGSESKEAVDLCRQKGIEPVYGQCLLMSAPPVTFPHSLHRFFARLFGKT